MAHRLVHPPVSQVGKGRQLVGQELVAHRSVHPPVSQVGKGRQLVGQELVAHRSVHPPVSQVGKGRQLVSQLFVIQVRVFIRVMLMTIYSSLKFVLKSNCLKIGNKLSSHRHFTILYHDNFPVLLSNLPVVNFGL